MYAGDIHTRYHSECDAFADCVCYNCIWFLL